MVADEPDEVLAVVAVGAICEHEAMTIVIAHRGAAGPATENTIEAFTRAVEMGADAVELDVRRSADDRLVVHHDAALSDGRRIRDVRWDDLPPFVPTLDDALDACDGVAVNIEIKNGRDDPDHDPSHWIAARLGAVLQRRGGGARWLISSFSSGTVERCRATVPHARTAWLCDRLDLDTITRAGGHDAIHPRVDGVTESGVRLAHGRGLAVNVWTCDDPSRMEQLIAWGVDGICTNVVDVALAVRARAVSR